MDWPIFLRTKDLPAFSGLSMDRIREVLAHAGVQPVDFGTRRSGLKWYRDAVKEALAHLHDEAQTAPAKFVRRKTTRLKIVGKTPAELFKELKGA